ncbi:L-arabinose isomerase [Pseudalkalibacillus salsuginis]|uniref:L-arabinose isomerase n=1 Tax=Pseudalkalibacillus salsuginis TaxID=2910972 RepID=UPI001F4746B3|nr:L-arabinose isomerase [Pseudalkalibacillus salsuginis]MCF6411525.1 L-arabinose isomerase [Pseudalkalibacillus salsuginis]
MLKIRPYEFWFVTGSQHLYGKEALEEVQAHSEEIVGDLNEKQDLPFRIVFKSVLTSSDDIHKVMVEANADDHCAGLLTWMHTFSPAKMWIAGLKALQKPLLHLHTQYNRDVPWDSIDMDFMNLNQSAHGDREYGFMVSRLNIARKVVVGHWKDAGVVGKMAGWMKTAVAHTEGSNIRVARFGDNMRNVAVTDGDKVEAQIKFGWTVDYYGIGDLVEEIEKVTEQEVEDLYHTYTELYDLIDGDSEGVQASIKEQARIELGLKSFLSSKNYNAFTTNFEDLHGMKQLPGLAVQRLMAEGYGFAGEGDWRTAALLRMMKIISHNKGTSFMEDYTYHLDPENEMVLGSHMLEICPTLSSEKPEIVVSRLDIGGKDDPARLVFNGTEGKAVNASLIELGGRFRLVVNEVEAVRVQEKTPHLPVAKVLWKPQPSLSEATESWIYAGGAHHTVFSTEVTLEQLYDFADMAGIECIIIDQSTNVRHLRNELKLMDEIRRV